MSLHVSPEVLYKWSAREFWTMQLYLSHKSNVQAEYHKLIMKRK